MEDVFHTGKYILNVSRLNLVIEVRETISSLKAGTDSRFYIPFNTYLTEVARTSEHLLTRLNNR